MFGCNNALVCEVGGLCELVCILSGKDKLILGLNSGPSQHEIKYVSFLPVLALAVMLRCCELKEAPIAGVCLGFKILRI